MKIIQIFLNKFFAIILKKHIINLGVLCRFYYFYLLIAYIEERVFSLSLKCRMEEEKWIL